MPTLVVEPPISSTMWSKAALVVEADVTDSLLLAWREASSSSSASWRGVGGLLLVGWSCSQKAGISVDVCGGVVVPAMGVSGSIVRRVG